MRMAFDSNVCGGILCGHTHIRTPGAREPLGDGWPVLTRTERSGGGFLIRQSNRLVDLLRRINLLTQISGCASAVELFGNPLRLKGVNSVTHAIRTAERAFQALDDFPLRISKFKNPWLNDLERDVP